MERIMKAICCTAILMFLSGCISFDESIRDYRPSGPVVDKPIADNCYVMPVFDIRPFEQRSVSMNINDDICINYIPLWFYSKTELNPIMKFDYFHLDLQDMMQILISRDLRASRMFQNVKMVRFEENTERPVFGYVVKIWITKAVWTRYITTYGMMFAGPVLWGLGLPVSYGEVSMEIEAELIDAQTKNVIAKEKMHAEESCMEFLSYHADYTPSVSEAKLCEIFPRLTSQLRAFILKNVTEKK